MFHSTRIKLTAWYLFIIMCVSGAFSMAIFRVTTGEIDRFEAMQRERIERRLTEGMFFPKDGFSPPKIIFHDPELLQDIKNRITVTLVVVNGVILILSGAFGYLLAGRTLAPIARMIEEQKRFVSDASHELKTPLTSLRLAYDVYLKEKRPTRRQTEELVQDSIAEINRLDKMTASLLSVARHQDQSDFPVKPVSVREIVTEAVKTISPQAKVKNISLEALPLPGIITGNRDSLVELFTILIDNAVKYSMRDSKVQFGSKISGKCVTVSVTDNGIGIPKNDLPHIFDRFYRADTSRVNVNQNGGYGLGLSIARQITDAHKAKIDVVSDEKGTVFMVRFPRS